MLLHLTIALRAVGAGFDFHEPEPGLHATVARL
jgi:hypothetical protein